MQQRPRPLDLPEPLPEPPPETWIATRSVIGPFGITAEVADFREVLDWQEKRRALTQGYFRLIHPPKVREFKLRLEARYPGWKVVLYASPGLALKEWIEACGARGCPERRLAAATPVPAWLAHVPDVHAGVRLPRAGEHDPADALCLDGLPDGPLHGSSVRILGLSDPLSGARAGVLLTPDAPFAELLHERNRRRGGSLSARDVFALMGEAPSAAPARPEEHVRILKDLEAAGDVFCYPSGMEAVTVALDLALTPERPRVLVMGHVYRDTHLILEEQPWCGRKVNATFLRTHDVEGLSLGLRDAGVGAVILETVTNPLIEVPDLPRIAQLAHAAGVPVLVDSTMATPANCRPLDWGADLVIHSTSKYLSGGNQHGGGAILVRDPAWIRRLREDQARWDNRLSPLEIPPLLEGLSTFPERMDRFNRNGLALAAFLRGHPAVSRVYHGESMPHPWLDGLGSVVSFELADPSQDAVARFFDAPMPGVHKAPSLGSDTTLFCPYVLLAYYDKTPAYLREHGIPRHLLRIAAGCERDFGPVLSAFSAALDRACPS